MIFVAAWAVSSAAQVPTFSVKTEEVRIDVLVAEHKKPVVGLKLSDFEVLDNGVLQQIEFVSPEEMPINAVLVLDVSASVDGERLDHLRNAGQAFLNGLKKDDRAALVTFDNSVALAAPLTSDIEPLKSALARLHPFGNTSLIDASYAGLMMGESIAGRSLVVLFSDGLDVSSWLTRDAVLETAKRSDAVLYAVSAGRLPGTAFLHDLSDTTGGKHYAVESTKDLASVFLNILNEFRQRYLLSYTPRGVSNTGWHRLQVRVKGRRVTIDARPGYLSGAARR
jgi:VWFA-related protein